MNDRHRRALDEAQARLPALDGTIRKVIPEGTGYALVIFAPVKDDGATGGMVVAGAGDAAMQVDAMRAAATAIAEAAETPPGDPIAFARDMPPDASPDRLRDSAARTVCAAARMTVDHLGLDRHTILRDDDPRASDLALGAVLVDATAHHWVGLLGPDPAQHAHIVAELRRALSRAAEATPPNRTH